MKHCSDFSVVLTLFCFVFNRNVLYVSGLWSGLWSGCQLSTFSVEKLGGYWNMRFLHNINSGLVMKHQDLAYTTEELRNIAKSTHSTKSTTQHWNPQVYLPSRRFAKNRQSCQERKASTSLKTAIGILSLNKIMH